jgi:DNA-binding response OmpR family regulator
LYIEGQQDNSLFTNMDPIIKKRNPTVQKKKLRILIVEDDRITAFSIQTILKDDNFNVVGIGLNGEHGIELAKNLKPDIVLMDINLGKGIDGIETAKRINKRKKTKIIFLSGNTHLLDQEILGEIKPVGILSKPILGIELIDIIRNVQLRGNSCDWVDDSVNFLKPKFCHCNRS